MLERINVYYLQCVTKLFFSNIKSMTELDKSLQIYVFLYKKQIYLRQFNELFY